MIFDALIFRQWGRQPLRTLLVVAAIALGVASAGATDLTRHSTHDEASYPALWRLVVPHDPPIAIAPVVLDQELVPTRGGVAFWNGAVDVADAEPPGRHLGLGFVQLTGYATPTDL